MKQQIHLRGIDRAIIALLAVFLTASGLYLVGPWYLPITNDGSGPLYFLTKSLFAVKVIGVVTLTCAAGLGYSAYRGAVRAKILTASLLATFILRSFVLYGTMLTLESWRPPSYTASIFVLALTGAYWLWFRVGVKNE